MNEHPARYWITFLISRCEHTFDEIKAMCHMVQLGAVTNEYLAHIRDALYVDMPVPFKGNSLAHRPSSIFIRKHQIHEAWARTEPMKEAIDLLSDPHRRALVETFILSPLKPGQAVLRINRKFDSHLTEDGYRLFQHYFWNNQLLNGEEWGNYIRQRRVAHSEWLQLAVKAQGPSGVQLLLWKTGVGAARHVNANKMFTHLRDIAYFKALELEHVPAGKEHSTAFRNYVQSAKMAQEEATASATAMTDILDSFRAFRLSSQEQEVTTVDALGGTISSPDEAPSAEVKESA